MPELKASLTTSELLALAGVRNGDVTLSVTQHRPDVDSTEIEFRLSELDRLEFKLSYEEPATIGPVVS